MSKSLGDILKSVNQSKEDIFKGEPEAMVKKDYVPFTINKSLSYFADSILHANEMNLHPDLPATMQYHYMLRSLRPRKRFAYWTRPIDSKKIHAVMDHYGFSYRVAEEAMKTLPDHVVEQMMEEADVGGDIIRQR